ncbi:MAG TPA: cytochrome c oxidase subunit 3 family protein [Phycisphaerales bacterium]|nr:cytochrome c oxidase subunit 3 family protein [Phycisphaerales bacterium]HMP36024.1 cytochrome c oxidase subunit 3 family protein [Phycisphaerales bacterium]
MSTIPADSSVHTSGIVAAPGDGIGAAGHDHLHEEYPFLQHHFETPAQQFDSAKLGMWLFLATEVLFFGGLFVWYAVLRSLHPEMFKYASQFLDTILGGINTCVLILSSLTMALAVRFAQTNKRRALVTCLCLTWLGAAGFLVIKYFEYTHKIEHQLRWGAAFYTPEERDKDRFMVVADPASIESQAIELSEAFTAPRAAPHTGVPAVETSSVAMAPAGPAGIRPGAGSFRGPPGQAPPAPHGHGGEHGSGGHEPHLADPDLPPNTHLFFGVYFAMTGLHGIHVIVGMGIITWLILAAMKGRFTSDYYTPVDLGGLYWHIVDLIWIFLFPLFYIIH